MKTRNLWMVLAVAVLGVGAAACGDDDEEGGAPTCTPPATATVGFHTDVHPILIASCGTCHGDAGTAQKYGSASRDTSYAAASAKVDTANPAASVLLVTGNGGNAHPGGDRLSDADAATIQQWITECAQNND